MIASMLEVESGVLNLWKRGKSNERRDCPNFGQRASINYFKCFMAAAPCCFVMRNTGTLTREIDRGMSIFLTRINTMRGGIV